MDICLMPARQKGEWTLALACHESHDATNEYLNCIKIIQVIEATIKISAHAPV